MTIERWPDARLKRFRYRVTTFGAGRADWRDTYEDAMEDAVRLGLASWDQSKRQHFLAVPVAIERQALPVGPIPPLSTRKALRRWLTEEDETLQALTRRDTDVIEIGRQLGRTVEAVRTRLRRLGSRQARR